MSHSFKSHEQVEFADLFAQAETHGLNQSDVARELQISRAAVSMYLKGGASNPSPRTLGDFRTLLKRLEGPGRIVPKVDSPEENLKILAARSPGLYEAAKVTLQVLRDQADKLPEAAPEPRYSASSSSLSPMQAAERQAASDARKDPVIPRQKRKAV